MPPRRRQESGYKAGWLKIVEGWNRITRTDRGVRFPESRIQWIHTLANRRQQVSICRRQIREKAHTILPTTSDTQINIGVASGQKTRTRKVGHRTQIAHNFASPTNE